MSADAIVDAIVARYEAASTWEARYAIGRELWTEYARRVAASGGFLCAHGESDTPCEVCRTRWSDLGRLLAGSFLESRRIAHWERSRAPAPPSRTRGFNPAAYEAAALTGERYDTEMDE